MGIILVIGAVVIFILGYEMPLLALALYPLAVVTLLIGIGLVSLNERITRLIDEEHKDYNELIERIEDLEDLLEEQNKKIEILQKRTQHMTKQLNEKSSTEKNNTTEES